MPNDIDVNDELDNDLDPEDDLESGIAEDKTKLGDQGDGSVVVEIDPATENEAEGEGDPLKKEETPEEREKIREQRRQERQDRKARQKEQQERTRRELESERTARRQLEERIALIERRSTGSELAQIDNAMTQTKNAYSHFKEQIKIGQQAGNGEMIADATEKMLIARDRYNQLDNVKKAYNQRQSQPAPLDPTLVRHANDFMSQHTWYRPDSPDEDSLITRTIDNKLASEGWDPKTKEYWEELNKRLKKYLPHRVKGATVQQDDGAQRVKPKSPVAGSGREANTSNAAKGTFRLSPERVSAMKDAGLWDDSKKRNEAIKRYRDYDKTNKGN